MPTDHPDVHFTDVRVGDDAVFGDVGRGLELANIFVHENRIRQAASSRKRPTTHIDEAERTRLRPGAPSSADFPLCGRGAGDPVSRSPGYLRPRAAMLRALIRPNDAWRMDRHGAMDVTGTGVDTGNYRANRLVCNAADQAMQTCGGMGYTRHMPFEHIYRHHRRYRITEGSEEIQIRRVAGVMFGKRAKR
nr:acyl-CoA dehydrogenase family protein [Candidatus Microthrix sp.]